MHLEDKKKSLTLFWTVFFIYVLVYMTKNCFSAAMASIVDAGVLTKSQTGLITAVFYLVYTPLQVIGGMVADRFKPALLIKVGLIGGGIANAIIFFHQNYAVILIAWVFNAIVQFAVWPGVFKIISSQLVPEQRSRAAFFMSFSSTAGLMVAYLVAAMVERWQDNFAISSVVLFLLTAIFHLVTKRIEPYMVPDTAARGIPDKPLKLARHGLSTGKILLMGGAYVVVSYILLRATVENGVKTLSATMLMESYEQVSPAVGNLLNTLVILAGVLGTLAVRLGLCRLIKDEIVGTILLLILCVPFIVLLHFIGSYNVWIAVGALCVIVGALNGTHYLALSYTMRFARYGLDGTAAGITNAAGALGIVIQSYGFTKLAEMTDWNTVADLWLVLVGVSAVLLVIVLPTWRRFTALEKQEETV